MINSLVEQVFYSATARKMKFSIKDFFSKCVQIRVQVQCVSGCRHHKWCAMLNLQNLFIVKAFLLFFIKLICLRELSSGVGIKHPYIEKCQLTCLPKSTSMYVQPHFIFLWLLMEQRTRLAKDVIVAQLKRLCIFH